VAELATHLALLAALTSGAGAVMVWLGLDRGLLQSRMPERRCPCCGRPLNKNRACPICARPPSRTAHGRTDDP
jgi:hypothetical protein